MAGWDSDDLWSDTPDTSDSTDAWSDTPNTSDAWPTDNSTSANEAWPVDNSTSTNDAWSNVQEDPWNSSSENNTEANDAWSEIDDYWGETTNTPQADASAEQAGTNTHNVKPIGTKALAFGVLGVGIVIALVILFISRIDISKKEPPRAPVTQNNTNTQTQAETDVSLTEVTGVSSNQEYTLSGTIHDKVYYAANNQVLCGIKIKMEFGSESQIWTYYCAYNIYKQVNIGDTVQVTYSKPNDKFIMIHGVSK